MSRLQLALADCRPGGPAPARSLRPRPARSRRCKAPPCPVPSGGFGRQQQGKLAAIAHPRAARHVHARGARTNQRYDARPAPRLAQGPDPETHRPCPTADRQNFQAGLQARWDALPADRKEPHRATPGSARTALPPRNNDRKSASVDPAPYSARGFFVLWGKHALSTCHDPERRRHHPGGYRPDLRHGDGGSAPASGIRSCRRP